MPEKMIEIQEIDSVFSFVILDSKLVIQKVSELFLNEFNCKLTDLLDQTIDQVLTFPFNIEGHSISWESIVSQKQTPVIKIQTITGQLFNCQIKVVQKPNNHYWLFFDKKQFIKNRVEQWKEAYDLYMELAKNSPDIICFKDGEGRWLFANDADLELFHLKGVDYVGKTDKDLADFTHESYKDAFLNCMDTDEKCWANGNISRQDEKISKPEGDDIVLDVIKIPVFNEDGSRKNLIVLGRDVTARRKAECDLLEAKKRAEESDRLKSNFLATMSHELRTPLNAVIGFANLIFEEQDLEEIREYSRIINNNSKMLLSLIEDIFDVSLIESDQIKIDQKPFDVVKSIKEVYEIFPMELNMLDKLDIDFKLNFDRNTFSYIGDEFRFKQIITNLIRNALKFTKAGYIHVQLEILEDYFNVTVKDTGIGISKDKLVEIFGLFRQVEEGYKRSFGGAGLGLSISKRLAEMMNGDILVESELDKGSTFTLRLPID